MAITPEDFGASFKDFMRQMAKQAPTQDPVFVRRLRDHFRCDPTDLPIVSETYEGHEHANVQVALDDLLGRPDVESEALGVTGVDPYRGADLASLVAPPKSGAMFGFGTPEIGPVQLVNIDLGEGRMLACMQSGLLLIRVADRPFAVLVRGPTEMYHETNVRLQVLAPGKESARTLLAGLRQTVRDKNVYRGRVLSLATTQFGGVCVEFHELPDVKREDIILPPSTLERIERQTIQFSRHRDALRAAGRHLKRGMLLYGPPGTGKTLSAMYVAGATASERTVILLTGQGFGMLGASCAMARALQPSTVILEDVDLVAEERTSRKPSCASPLLFELLNEMDGLADDADVLFLLTTNRADLLEPALAARPGRIDQAVEVPLPDGSCRRRLFELYGRGMSLAVEDLGEWIARTEGASAAFIRELMRKAALAAAIQADSDEVVVTRQHFDEALRDLVVVGGELTQSLLGYRSPGRS